jgi:hypothetical protein
MSSKITVENKFEIAKRDIHVRLKQGETKRTAIVKEKLDYPGKGGKTRAAIPLGKDEYLEISVENEGSNLEPCCIELPCDLQYTYYPNGRGKIILEHFYRPGPIEAGKSAKLWTRLRIPQGKPKWKLGIMMAPKFDSPETNLGNDDPGSGSNVNVGDDGPGG